jgi:hypothetical protein
MSEVKLKSKVLPNPVIPTGDRRHTTAVQFGRLSYDQVFAKKRLAEIPLDFDVDSQRAEKVDIENATKAL